MVESDYVIPIKGIADGIQEYRFDIGSDLFEYFESDLVSDAKMDAIVLLEKSGTYLSVKCNLKGEVVVECDRCLEDLSIPMNFEIVLTVKFVKNIEENITSEDFLLLDYAETELDLRQFIYDYTIIKLPLQKVHEMDKCNPTIIERLGLSEYYEDLNEEKELNRTENDGDNSPFSQLKKLLN